RSVGEAVARGVSGSFDAVAGADLGVDVRDVARGGAGAEDERVGDLACAAPARDQAEDFGFARRERIGVARCKPAVGAEEPFELLLQAADAAVPGDAEGGTGERGGLAAVAGAASLQEHAGELELRVGEPRSAAGARIMLDGSTQEPLGYVDATGGGGEDAEVEVGSAEAGDALADDEVAALVGRKALEQLLGANAITERGADEAQEDEDEEARVLACGCGETVGGELFEQGAGLGVTAGLCLDEGEDKIG